MRTPSEPENGIVGILDALGAASYGDPEIRRFIITPESFATIRPLPQA